MLKIVITNSVCYAMTLKASWLSGLQRLHCSTTWSCIQFLNYEFRTDSGILVVKFDPEFNCMVIITPKKTELDSGIGGGV